MTTEHFATRKAAEQVRFRLKWVPGKERDIPGTNLTVPEIYREYTLRRRTGKKRFGLFPTTETSSYALRVPEQPYGTGRDARYEVTLIDRKTGEAPLLHFGVFAFYDEGTPFVRTMARKAVNLLHFIPSGEDTNSFSLAFRRFHNL